jgi:microcompartment protein CcmL/EutN
MTQRSLGLIETAGLTAAVTAADAAVKSANVELVGYELAKGSGMTTVKLLGDVGAVKAAVAAGAAAGAAVGRLVSTSVIARPASGIHRMIASKETVGAKTEKSPAPAAESGEHPVETRPDEPSPADEAERAGTGAEQEAPAGQGAGSPAPVAEPAESTKPAEPTEPAEAVHFVTGSQTETTDTVRPQPAPAKYPGGKVKKKSGK